MGGAGEGVGGGPPPDVTPVRIFDPLLFEIRRVCYYSLLSLGPSVFLFYKTNPAVAPRWFARPGRIQPPARINAPADASTNPDGL